MALVLNEDQNLLVESARGFLAENAPVSAFRKLRNERSEDGFSRALWGELAQMGWAGVLIDEDKGGAGFGFVGAGLIAEEMGRTLAATPFLSTSVLAATAFSKFAGSAMQEEHLPKIASGAALYALAVDEGRKHAPEKTALRAEKSGNGFSLTGEKTFVADGAAGSMLEKPLTLM